jgi:NitT/TauT family transport system permease protein
VSTNLRLSGWQRFWKLEVPFAMPGMVWNMMMSMSGGWFFVVASEAITVGDKTITLPGSVRIWPWPSPRKTCMPWAG